MNKVCFRFAGKVKDLQNAIELFEKQEVCKTFFTQNKKPLARQSKRLRIMHKVHAKPYGLIIALNNNI